MRLRALCVTALVLAGVASGQAGRGLVLVGNRVAPLKYDGMTPEQRLMADHLMAGERGRRPGGPRGPFNVLMRSPEAGDFAQQFGEVMRFGTGLPKDVSEVIILMTGRYWGAQFEWASHKPAALDAGAKPEILEAIRVGKRPAGMNRDTEIAYNFIDELLTTHQVSDATFGAAKERYGVQGVVDMVGLSGWYGIVSMCLNLDQYPLDPGDKPALGALANPLPVVGAGFATPIPGKPDPVTVRSSANGKEFTLIGDRLRPPTWEQMTAEQKKFTEEALAGRGTGGSFPVSLHSPVMGRQLFGLGERVRFHMSVPDRLKELAILLTARYWAAQYEWSVHQPAAIQAGLSEAKVKAIAEGRRPQGMAADEELVYNFISELYKTHQVSDARFAEVKKAFGERGMVDLVITAGYYQIVSMEMNVDRMPLGNGAAAPLKPIAKPLP